MIDENIHEKLERLETRISLIEKAILKLQSSDEEIIGGLHAFYEEASIDIKTIAANSKNTDMFVRRMQESFDAAGMTTPPEIPRPMNGKDGLLSGEESELAT